MSSELASNTASRLRGAGGEAPVDALYVSAGERGRPFAVPAGVLRVEVAGDLTDALRRLTDRAYGICFVDLDDERGAIPLIRLVRTEYPAMPVVAVGNADAFVRAGDAIQAGAADVLPRPVTPTALATVLTKATSRAPAAPVWTSDWVAISPAMRHVQARVGELAASAEGVAVSGEPGSGRTFVARAIHDQSPDRPGAFVAVDCASASASDLELRLFGRRTEGRRSAQEGIDQLGPGAAVLRARRGTLFLTRVAEAPSRIQLRLARLLRDGEARVGSRRTLIDLGVRLMVALEPRLAEQAVADGQIRAELFDRVSRGALEVPALRQRREDIPVLAVRWLARRRSARGLGPNTLSHAALTWCAALPWPGNVPELRTTLDRLAGRVEGDVIQLEDVIEVVPGVPAAEPPPAGLTLREARARFEREWIAAALIRHQGRAGDAARALGIQRTNLYRKVRQLGVSRSLLHRRAFGR